MRSLTITALTLLSIGIFTPSLHAQEAEEAELSPQQAREVAREAYARGQEAFRAGNHADAEEAFMEAYAAVPNPVVLLGIAEARQAQGNIQGAVQALETYLEERADAPDAAEVQARVEEMKGTPAVLVIGSTPPGATIVLDGEDTGELTPAEIEVPPGAHVVAIRYEGYEPAEREVDAVFASRPEVNVELSQVAPPEPTLEGDGEEVPAADLEDLEDVEEDDAGPGTAVWALSSVAAASLVAGTVLGFLALTEESEFDDVPSESTADKGERYALFADIAFGVAAVTAISAIVVFLTQDDDEDDDGEEESTTALYPVVSPTGAGLVGHVQF